MLHIFPFYYFPEKGHKKQSDLRVNVCLTAIFYTHIELCFRNTLMPSIRDGPKYFI